MRSVAMRIMERAFRVFRSAECTVCSFSPQAPALPVHRALVIPREADALPHLLVVLVPQWRAKVVGPLFNNAFLPIGLGLLALHGNRTSPRG